MQELNDLYYVALEFLEASMKMAVFWAVSRCRLVEIYRRFWSACCLRHCNPEHNHLPTLYCSDCCLYTGTFRILMLQPLKKSVHVNINFCITKPLCGAIEDSWQHVKRAAVNIALQSQHSYVNTAPFVPGGRLLLSMTSPTPKLWNWPDESRNHSLTGKGARWAIWNNLTDSLLVNWT
jgi:hypothetical protein